MKLPLLCFVACASILSARTISVADAAAFSAACAEAKPGDTLVLHAGDWRDANLVFRANGTEREPITLTVENPGGTRLTGHSQLAIEGDYLVVRGLVFTEGWIERGAVVGIHGPDNRDSRGCRITDCAFIRYNPPAATTTYTWLQVRGSRHRVDHCRFEGGNHKGLTLQIQAGDGENRHQIDHNHFLDRVQGSANNYETIQVWGQSGRDCSSVVEYNLFESCDGEQEIISNKSGGNVYRKNTFLHCAGTLTLRDGPNATVESNIFLGGGKEESGGVRVIDRGHVIRGNYFHGLTGRHTAGGVIGLYAGQSERTNRLYATMSDVLIEDNVFVGDTANGINLSAGYLSRERTVLPHNVTIRNNWFDLDPRHGVTVLTGTPGEGLKCEGNFHSGSTEIGLMPPGGGFAQTPLTLDPDAPVPLQPPLAAPATTEHRGWRATMATLELLSAKDVGPAWWPQPKSK